MYVVYPLRLCSRMTSSLSTIVFFSWYGESNKGAFYLVLTLPGFRSHYERTHMLKLMLTAANVQMILLRAHTRDTPLRKSPFTLSLVVSLQNSQSGFHDAIPDDAVMRSPIPTRMGIIFRHLILLWV
jgi:hypothetical protein